MSDAVLIAFIGSSSTTVAVIVSAWINAKGNKKIVAKVDVLHDQVNGKMEKLLDTTEKLANATGKAEGIAEKQVEVDQLNKDSQPKQ